MTSAAQRAYTLWHDAGMDDAVLAQFRQYQLAQSLAPKTVHNREYILRPLARYIGVPLVEATTAHLRSYLARPGKKPATLRVERAAMLAFYTFLHDEGIRDDNPTTRLAPIRVPRNIPRPFTLEQIDAMLNSGVYTRTRAMIILGYAQGFRVSQIARVRGDDIQGDQIRTLAKGGKEGVLPLSPTVRELAKTMPKTGWWFPSPRRDGPIKAESVTDAITNAIHLAGITDPRLTPHSLRHTFASQLVEQGVDIRVIQELMMHDDIGTTQIYAKVSDRKRMAGIVTLPTVQIPDRSMRAAA